MKKAFIPRADFRPFTDRLRRCSFLLWGKDQIGFQPINRWHACKKMEKKIQHLKRRRKEADFSLWYEINANFVVLKVSHLLFIFLWTFMSLIHELKYLSSVTQIFRNSVFRIQFRQLTHSRKRKERKRILFCSSSSNSSIFLLPLFLPSPSFIPQNPYLPWQATRVVL